VSENSYLLVELSFYKVGVLIVALCDYALEFCYYNGDLASS
jgi:hypothetical protein